MTTTQTPSVVSHRPRLRLRDEDGVRYGIAHAGLVAAALLAGAADVPPSGSFALLSAAAVLGGHGVAAHWRIGIALAAWAIWTGFFENTLGLLTFSGPDVLRLTALCVLAAVGIPLARPFWARLGS